MERILNNNDRVKRAEEIYHRRKIGSSSSRFSKVENEKKSYLGSKILLEVLLVINLSVMIMSFQNKEYIFTEKFLSDVENYNVNITKAIREFIGIETSQAKSEDETDLDSHPAEVEIQENNNDSASTEEIVPNEEEQASSSLNEMDENIDKVKELVDIQKPILEGTVTSRFGTRESSNKNVEGYHTGIDIGATKRYLNLFSNFSEQLLWYRMFGNYRKTFKNRT